MKLLLMCLLLVGCGKPIEESNPGNKPIDYRSSFTLSALMSFDPEYSIDGEYQTMEMGWYDLPFVIRRHRFNNRSGWVHIDHDRTKYCYKTDGSADYSFNHSRKSNSECASPKGRDTHRRSRFFVTWKVPVILRIEENCDNLSPCRTIEVEVTITEADS